MVQDQDYLIFNQEYVFLQKVYIHIILIRLYNQQADRDQLNDALEQSEQNLISKVKEDSEIELTEQVIKLQYTKYTFDKNNNIPKKQAIIDSITENNDYSQTEQEITRAVTMQSRKDIWQQILQAEANKQ